MAVGCSLLSRAKPLRSNCNQASYAKAGTGKYDLVHSNVSFKRGIALGATASDENMRAT
jgi:hypothetical protein